MFLFIPINLTAKDILDILEAANEHIDYRWNLQTPPEDHGDYFSGDEDGGGMIDSYSRIINS